MFSDRELLRRGTLMSFHTASGMTCPNIRHRHGPVYVRKRAPQLRVWIDAIAPIPEICGAFRES
jgi:hypothetical protein